MQDIQFPRYLHPTLASITSGKPCAHDEVERILNSFNCGSLNSLKKLPPKLGPGEIASSKLKAMINNRCSNTTDAFKTSSKNSYFEPFKYNFSDYNVEETNAKFEAENKRLGLQSFSRKPFNFSSTRAKMKHEDIFEDSTYKYPLMGPSAEGVNMGSLLRQPDKSKMLAGSFSVSGGPARLNKSQIDGCVSHIFSKLCQDWPQLRFAVKYTSSEEILVDFDADLVDNIDAVRRYISYDAQHGKPAELKLRKRGDRWGIIEDGKIVFCYSLPGTGGASWETSRKAAKKERDQSKAKLLAEKMLLDSFRDSLSEQDASGFLQNGVSPSLTPTDRSGVILPALRPSPSNSWSA